MLKNRYILLDRDGVINQDSDSFIKSPEEWQPIEGSLDAIALLNRHGYKIAIITNQSGLSRGLFDEAMLEKIHAKMQQMVEEKGGKIDAIYVCPHGPGDECNCRKPKPGMLETFASEHSVDLKDIAFIGDSLRDMQAARAVGAIPILVKTGKGQKTLSNNPGLHLLFFENLYEAAKHITSEK
ncbi:MAG: D-glycero-beta-D-manno-heptose 1,7-bisphosphate 7-phosphatase [Methylococcales bacterium]|nr:D-glycero-beta-D-manno-heptose 1,7-bisphosphate 7-phosphatase [Methylococcales bacterium]